MKRLLLLSILALASPLFAQDAMFRGNAEHTGAYGATGVPNFTGVKWQFHTMGQVLSSPAIAGDKLYFGSSDHSLYALDLSTGALKWKFKSDGRITSSPAVSANVVYFGSFDGKFYAVDVDVLQRRIWQRGRRLRIQVLLLYGLIFGNLRGGNFPLAVLLHPNGQHADWLAIANDAPCAQSRIAVHPNLFVRLRRRLRRYRRGSQLLNSRCSGDDFSMLASQREIVGRHPAERLNIAIALGFSPCCYGLRKVRIDRHIVGLLHLLDSVRLSRIAYYQCCASKDWPMLRSC